MTDQLTPLSEMMSAEKYADKIATWKNAGLRQAVVDEIATAQREAYRAGIEAAAEEAERKPKPGEIFNTATAKLIAMAIRALPDQEETK